MRARTRFRPADLLVVLIVAVATIALAAFTSWPGSPAGPLPSIEATVLAGTPGKSIPAGFLGLSTEFRSVVQYAGTDSRAINPVFVRLVRALAQGRPLSLRIGGDSTDSSWWPVPGVARPPGVTYTLGHQWLTIAASLTKAVHARLILGINLEANNVEIALAEANAFKAGFPGHSIQALELGNEPGLYSRFPYYHTANGRAVTGRPPGYGYQGFLEDFNRFSATLLGNPLAGPGIAKGPWLDHFGPFLRSQPEVQLATLHRYPLQDCYTRPGSPEYPTFDNLMSAAASAGLAADVRRYARVAHANHVALRIDELNTVSCGANRAISQSFASALWVLKTLFALAGAGVDGVNVHTFPGAGYELFRFVRTGKRWEAFVAPEYYGLLSFVRAAPVGSRLIPVEQTASNSVSIWATRSAPGTVRVVVVNQGSDPRHVVIRVAGGSRAGVTGAAAPAMLEQLLAPGVRATGGVSLGGQSYASPTTTATLVGARSQSRVQSTAAGYAFEVPAAGAALLTIG